MEKERQKKSNVFLVIFVIVVFAFSTFSTFYSIKKTDDYVKFVSPKATSQGNVSLCIDVAPPEIDSIGVFNITPDEPFEYDINATSPSNRTIYYFDNTDLFEINVSTGMINFTPVQSNEQLYIINITASHGICSNTTGGGYMLLVFLCPNLCPNCTGATPPGGGGGGGGATIVVSCEENWVCGSWFECNNLSVLSESKSDFTKILCNEQSIPFDNCGLQTRNCADLNLCGTINSKPNLERACYVYKNATTEKPTIRKIIPIIPGIINPYENYIILGFIVLVVIAWITYLFVLYENAHKSVKKPIIRPAVKHDRLHNYVEKALKMGIKKEDIRKRLLEKNWPQEVVDEAMKKAS